MFFKDKRQSNTDRNEGNGKDVVRRKKRLRPSRTLSMLLAAVMLLSFSSVSGADYAEEGADSALSVTGENGQTAPLPDANDIADSAAGAESDEEPDEDAATEPSVQNVSDKAAAINAEQSAVAGEPVAVKKSRSPISLMSAENPSTGYTDLADGNYLQVNASGVVEAASLGTLKKIYIPQQAKNTDGVLVDITAVNANVFAGKGLEGVEFSPNSKITTIGAGAFSGNASMVVEGGFLPTTLKTIGNQAFMNTGITQVDLPGSLTSIGTEAFRESKLTSIDIPGSIKNLSISIFYNCTSLTSATLNEGLETISSSCFYNCSLGKNNGEVTIPSTVKSVGGNVFNGNADVTINAPDHTPSQLTIGNNSGRKFLYYKDTHTDSYWFIDDATGLLGGIKKKGSVPSATYPIDSNGKLTIPAQVGDTVVTGIGYGIFLGYTNSGNPSTYSTIKTISFEQGSEVETIGPYVFASTTYLTSVTFPDTLKTVANTVFYGCTNLGPVTFPSNVETLGDSLFTYDTNLTSVTFSGSKVTSISTSVFSYTGMAVKDIYFPQMEKDSVAGAPWGAQYATIHWANDETTAPLTHYDSVTGFYYTDAGFITGYDGPTGSTVDLLIPGNINGTPITSLDYAAMKGISGGFRHVTIGEGITYIDREFMQSTPVKELSLPASKVTFGRDAFNNCGIESLHFSPNSTLTTIGTSGTGSIFANNKLTELNLPDSVQEIGISAFLNNQLTGEIVISPNVTRIYVNTFSGNPGITQFTVKQTRATAASRAFMASVPWGVPNASVVFQPLSTGVSASFVQTQTANGRGEQGVIYYTATLPFGDFIDKVVLPDSSEEVIDGYLTNTYQAAPFTVRKNGTYTFTLHTKEGTEIPLNVEITQFGEVEINADAELNVNTGDVAWLSSATAQDIIGRLWNGSAATAKDLDSGNAATLSISAADVVKVQGLLAGGDEAEITLNASYERGMVGSENITNTASKAITVKLDVHVYRTFAVRTIDLQKGIGKLADDADGTITVTYNDTTAKVAQSDIPVAEPVVPAEYVSGDVTFLGWYLNDTFVGADKDALYAAIKDTAVGYTSLTYEARFKLDADHDGTDDRDQGKVTFDLDPGKTGSEIRGVLTYGGSSKDDSELPFTVKGDKGAGLPAVSATAKTDDYRFEGWTIGDGTALSGKDGFAANQITFTGDTIKNPVVYKGVFSSRVKFAWDDDKVSTPAGSELSYYVMPGSALEDAGQAVPTITASNAYTFLGWTAGGETIQAPAIYTTPVDEPITYEAVFGEKPIYRITYDLGGGIGSVPDKTGVKWSDTGLLPASGYAAPAGTGYVIEKWVTDTGMEVTGATAYYEIAAAENASQDDTAAITVTAIWAEPVINVSVPVKLIFAAFESDNGAITAPKYHIKNNGSYPVDVSVDSLTIENADTLNLTATPSVAGDVSLKLRGSGTLPFNGTDFLTESPAINAPIGTLAAAGDVYDTKYFTFEGTYNGSFDTPKQPNYVLGFRFALSP